MEFPETVGIEADFERVCGIPSVVEEYAGVNRAKIQIKVDTVTRAGRTWRVELENRDEQRQGGGARVHDTRGARKRTGEEATGMVAAVGGAGEATKEKRAKSDGGPNG